MVFREKDTTPAYYADRLNEISEIFRSGESNAPGRGISYPAAIYAVNQSVKDACLGLDPPLTIESIIGTPSDFTIQYDETNLSDGSGNLDVAKLTEIVKNVASKWAKVKVLPMVSTTTTTSSAITLLDYERGVMAYVDNLSDTMNTDRIDSEISSFTFSRINFDKVLNSIRGLAGQQLTVELVHAPGGAPLTYCHSSCHSSCHTSRGRR